MAAHYINSICDFNALGADTTVVGNDDIIVSAAFDWGFVETRTLTEKINFSCAPGVEIQNLTKPLFFTVGTGSRFTDVTIRSVNINEEDLGMSGANSYVGALVCCGSQTTSSDLIFNSCVIGSGQIHLKYTDKTIMRHIGGLAGYVAGCETVIQNCVNAAGILVENERWQIYAGGICGYTQGSAAFTGNTNQGDISANTSGVTLSGTDAGGICGHISGSVTFIGNVNAGNISARGVEASLGGICGHSYYDHTVVLSGSFTDNTNHGNIAAISGAGQSFSGGICGRNAGRGQFHNFTNNTNKGGISASSDKFTTYAGGICGMCVNGTFTDSSNKGDVSARAVSYYAYAGGICGHGDHSAFTGNTNQGHISAVSDLSAAYSGDIC